MKRFFLSLLLSLSLIFTPFAQPVAASDRLVQIGSGETAIFLTPDAPYYQNHQAAESCDISTDDSCTAYFDFSDWWFPSLYLKNYQDDAIYVRGGSFQSVHVKLSGENQITTTGEYGINVSVNYFYIENSHPELSPASLTINVNSSTTRANAIINEAGDVSLEEKTDATFNVNSTLPAENNSTDEVTGITTPADKNVTIYMNDNLIINNPTGSFGIYTGHFYAVQAQIGGENYGYRPFATITHKINDGFGNAFLNNDFEDSTLASDPKIIATQPEYTFRHDKTATLGTFKLLPAVRGFSANYDDTLEDGENFDSAEARIISSLVKELHPETITDLACLSELEGLCPYNPNLFEIDKTKTELVIAKDVHSGTYRNNSEATISAEENYALKIHFRVADPKNYAFSKIDTVAPMSAGILNGLETANYHIDGPARVYLSPEEIYILAPLTVRSAFAVTSEPEPEEKTEEQVTEIIQDTDKTIIPKAPNTGVVL